MVKFVAALIPPTLGLVLGASTADAGPAYRQTATVQLGAPDRWDYLVADAEGARVYIAHGDRVDVLDAKTDKVIGSVTGIPGGTHGTAVSRATGQGFTDDGRAGRVIAFDLRSLKVIRTVPAKEGADAIAADPVTGRIFVVEGDPATITVVDTVKRAASQSRELC